MRLFSRIAASLLVSASCLAPAALSTAFADATTEELNFRSGPAS